MKVYIQPGVSGDVLTTIAVGAPYMEAWEAHAKPGLEAYCRRHGLGLIAFDRDLLPEGDPNWKKPTWQKMLIAESLAMSGIQANNVCYVDSDILVNPFAPNIFNEYDPETIGLVSQIHGLPQPLHETLRRLAFLRHTHYDKLYPLESSLFMTPTQIFEHHGLAGQPDYACMGLILFNVANHRHLMRDWFEKYDRTVQSLTGGGDEPHMNYEIQSWGRITWLPYRFQALWTYEAAWKYPFLFARREDKNLIRECIEASLYANYFLHFAGSWYESDMWKIGGVFQSNDARREIESYYAYLKIPVMGIPKGLIKPSTAHSEGVK
jgi:hypothetical protein